MYLRVPTELEKKQGHLKRWKLLGLNIDSVQGIFFSNEKVEE